jgi:hypothetical protein
MARQGWGDRLQTSVERGLGRIRRERRGDGGFESPRRVDA